MRVESKELDNEQIIINKNKLGSLVKSRTLKMV